MKDLTNLKTYIIDSDDPHEVDDAISLEIKEGNKKNLWIHISNPCKLFLHDSNIDLDARKRNSSLYLIDQYVPMLPNDILEKANLAQNKVSETISAAIEFNDDGSINNYENFIINCNIVRNNKSIYNSSSSVKSMNKSIPNLIKWLKKSNTLPIKSAFLTGTGIIPPPEFTLNENDQISITIDGIGTLNNTVIKV